MADSATATITVGDGPAITTQPASQTIATGTTAALSVVATGPGLHYQWYRGASGTTTTPVGTDSASFTTPALTTATNYWVRASNTFGTADSATAAITIGIGPAITTQPASQTIATGTTAALSVGATGAGLHYQWYQGASGTTTTPVGTDSASFTTPPLTVSTSYWVRVSNTFGTADSATAAITVNTGGGGGGAPFSYFGSFSRYPTTDNGSSGSGKTVAIAPPAGMTSGQLAVVVTLYRSTGNKGQSVNVSAAGGQTWHSEPEFLVPSGELYERVFWTEFNGTWSANPSFIVDTGGSSADAFTLYGLVFNAAPGVGIDVPFSPVDLGSTSSLHHSGIAPTVDGALVLVGVGQARLATLSGWTAGWTNANGETQWRNSRGNDDVLGVAYKIAPSGPTGAVGATSSESKESAAFMIAFRNPPGGSPVPPTITTDPASQAIATGTTAALSVVATGAALHYQWYQGASGTTTTPVGTDSASFTTPALTVSTSYWVRVSNAGGTADSATATITVGDGPAITTQPASQTIATGTTAAFSVVATGTGLHYQWYQGASGTTTTPVGTDSASFTTPALTTATNYWVRVSNTFGTADSATAAITIGVGPAITTQPASQTIASGATANLSVVATGAALHYQWYQGASGTTTTPVGTDSASFTTPALTVNTSYWVRVSNTFGTADSATAAITIGVGPAITTQPASQTIASGATANLSVVATGAGLHYQWYQGASGTTTTPVGTDSASFTTPALTVTTNYWVRVSNTFGTADSATATITVGDGPAITTQPASQTIATGTTAALSVVATGAGLHYQWYQGTSGTTTTPVGTDSASFTTPALTTATNYWVRVSNTFGTADSATAAITIGVGPAITTPPASQTIASGDDGHAQCRRDRRGPALPVVSGHERDDDDAGRDRQRELHDAGADGDDQLLGPGEQYVRDRGLGDGDDHGRRRAGDYDPAGEPDDRQRSDGQPQCRRDRRGPALPVVPGRERDDDDAGRDRQRSFTTPALTKRRSGPTARASQRRR